MADGHDTLAGDQHYGLRALRARSAADAPSVKLLLEAIEAGERGAHDEARELIERAAAAAPGWSEPLRLAGWLAHKTGDPGRAARLYRAAVGADPASLNARYCYAFYLTTFMHAHEEALVLLEEVLARDPDAFSVLTAKALVLARLGRHAHAAALYRAVSAHLPAKPRHWRMAMRGRAIECERTSSAHALRAGDLDVAREHVVSALAFLEQGYRMGDWDDRHDADAALMLSVARRLAQQAGHAGLAAQADAREREWAALRERWARAASAWAVGQRVDCRVVSWHAAGAWLELPDGLQGHVARGQLAWGGAPALRGPPLAPGASVPAVVTGVEPDEHAILLSLKQATPDPWPAAVARFQPGDRVKGVVSDLRQDRVLVTLDGGIVGAVPASELAWGKIAHPAEVVGLGDPIEVLVVSIDLQKHRVRLSRKQLLPGPWDEVATRCPTGCLVEGTVTNIVDYGAFVEVLDGLEGLLHVTDLSWSQRVGHPSEVLAVGQRVQAIVLHADPAQRRLALGLKQLRMEPWQAEIVSRLGHEAACVGTVLRVDAAGALVDLPTGLQGVLPPAELAGTDGPRAGDRLPVKVCCADASERSIVLAAVRGVRGRELLAATQDGSPASPASPGTHGPARDAGPPR